MIRTMLVTAAAAALLLSSGCKDKAKEGWHCVAFTYDGKRRIHCEPSKKKCDQRREEAKELATDLTACRHTEEVYCFDTGSEPSSPVCAPSMDNCDYIKKLHAQALPPDATGRKYSECYQLEGEGKAKGKSGGEAEETGGSGGKSEGSEAP